MNDISDPEYSVCQFFPDGQYEYVRRFVPMATALAAFKTYITSVGAKLGTTVRVIVTDGGDSIVMEWERDKGVTHPPAVAEEFKGQFVWGQS